jgi:hypothetical protein
VFFVYSYSSSGSGAYAPDALQPVGLSCDPIIDVPTFADRCLHVHTTREILTAKGGTVGENFGRYFCLNADFQVTFRDLLHVTNLRHGTDGLTSSPKEGVLRFFFALKNPDGFGRV